MFHVYWVTESYGDHGFTTWVHPYETANEVDAAERLVEAAAGAFAYGNLSYGYATPLPLEFPAGYPPLGVPECAVVRSTHAPVYLRLSFYPPDPTAAFLDHLHEKLDSARWVPEGALDAQVIIARSYQGTTPGPRVRDDGARSRSETFSVAFRYDDIDARTLEAKLALDLPVKLAHIAHDDAHMPVLVRLAAHKARPRRAELLATGRGCERRREEP